MVFGEIFPLQQDSGESALDTFDKFINEIVVFLVHKPFVAPSDVKLIFQLFLIVRADINGYRQDFRWMQATGRDVQTDFADRNSHAVCALVAKSQDSFAIGDNDQADRRERD